MGVEKNRETAIKHYIACAGGWVTKVQAGKIQQTYNNKKRWIHLAEAGTPDLLACIGGRFVAIEVKSDRKGMEKWEAYPLGLTGKPVKHNSRIENQKRVAEKIKERGGVFILACCVEDVEDGLIEAGVINRPNLLV